MLQQPEHKRRGVCRRWRRPHFPQTASTQTRVRTLFSASGNMLLDITIELPIMNLCWRLGMPVWRLTSRLTSRSMSKTPKVFSHGTSQSKRWPLIPTTVTFREAIVAVGVWGVQASWNPKWAQPSECSPSECKHEGWMWTWRVNVNPSWTGFKRNNNSTYLQNSNAEILSPK